MDLRIWSKPGDDAYVRGHERLSQRVLSYLLQRRGSVKFPGLFGRQPLGTTFLDALNSDQIQNEADLFAAFTAAEQQMRSALRAEESPRDPPNERYLRSRAVRLQLTDETATLTIRVYSRDGDVEVDIPINLASQE